MVLVTTSALRIYVAVLSALVLSACCHGSGCPEKPVWPREYSQGDVKALCSQRGTVVALNQCKDINPRESAGGTSELCVAYQLSSGQTVHRRFINTRSFAEGTRVRYDMSQKPPLPLAEDDQYHFCSKFDEWAHCSDVKE